MMEWNMIIHNDQVWLGETWTSTTFKLNLTFEAQGIYIYVYIYSIHFNIAAKFSSKAWLNACFFLLAWSSNGWAGTWCPHVYHSNSICCWQLEFWCVCVRMCSFWQMNTFFPPNFALSFISCFDLLPLDRCREDHYIFRPHVLSHRTWIYHKLLGPDLRQLYWVAASRC